jgi:hypothetical protein
MLLGRRPRCSPRVAGRTRGTERSVSADCFAPTKDSSADDSAFRLPPRAFRLAGLEIRPRGAAHRDVSRRLQQRLAWL